MWSGEEGMASVFVEDIAAILRGGKIGRISRLPEGKRTILSAMQPKPYCEVRHQERQRDSWGCLRTVLDNALED